MLPKRKLLGWCVVGSIPGLGKLAMYAVLSVHSSCTRMYCSRRATHIHAHPFAAALTAFSSVLCALAHVAFARADVSLPRAPRTHPHTFGRRTQPVPTVWLPNLCTCAICINCHCTSARNWRTSSAVQSGRQIASLPPATAGCVECSATSSAAARHELARALSSWGPAGAAVQRRLDYRAGASAMPAVAVALGATTSGRSGGC